ncbi:MAG: transposase DNA-binding-containing protein, partial [Candidatus Competibacteraceae bacterium]
GMSWAREEFKDLELGDARRTQRVIKLVDDLSAQPTGSIPLACGGWPETKAAYRLLDNPAVEWREILEVHTTRTVERMAGQPVVLCIQDTTPSGFHVATGDCRAGAAELRGPARAVRASDLGGDAGGGGVGGARRVDVGAEAERPARRQGKYPLGRRRRDRGRSGRSCARQPGGCTWRIGKATCGR